MTQPTKSDRMASMAACAYLVENAKPKDEERVAQIIAEELEKERCLTRKMAAFIHALMYDVVFEGCDLDGGNAQELAAKYGILEPFTVTQEQIDNDELCHSDYFEAGDTAYHFNDQIKQLASEYEAEKVGG